MTMIHVSSQAVVERSMAVDQAATGIARLRQATPAIRPQATPAPAIHRPHPAATADRRPAQAINGIQLSEVDV